MSNTMNLYDEVDDVETSIILVTTEESNYITILQQGAEVDLTEEELRKIYDFTISYFEGGKK